MEQSLNIFRRGFPGFTLRTGSLHHFLSGRTIHLFGALIWIGTGCQLSAADVWRVDPRPGPVWKEMVLEDALRQPYDIGRATRRRSTLLAVLRGHWDPYSIQLLKELRNSEQEILNKGYQIIAVTPDNPFRMRGILDRLDLPFVLCSDPGLKVAASLGLVRPMPAEREKELRDAGIKFRESESEPVPRMADQSLVVIGEDGLNYLQVSGMIEKVPFNMEELGRVCGVARGKSSLNLK